MNWFLSFLKSLFNAFDIVFFSVKQLEEERIELLFRLEEAENEASQHSNNVKIHNLSISKSGEKKVFDPYVLSKPTSIKGQIAMLNELITRSTPTNRLGKGESTFYEG